MRLEIYTDGACSGNPGPASIGVVILENGKTIKTVSRAIGNATNNIAEYMALLVGLGEAMALKARDVTVYTDSELMARQIGGQYKVKEPFLRSLFELAMFFKGAFESLKVVHIPREKNAEADRLAREGMKAQVEF